ncbi:MAG TPA: hypothetical protein VGI33_04195 [Paenibacillus sp.]|jgi:ABC-type bacteriocin/lantibiotic exporter with double-glycine peptidase domain
MDQDTEVLLQNLSKTGENKTIVVITHKESAIADFSNIIVIEDGKIQKNGTYIELHGQ